MKPKIILLLLLIFFIIGFILTIISLFLPWYYERIDFDQIDIGFTSVEIDGLYDMEERLNEREIYTEFIYFGEIDKETTNQDNNELKHDYPNTANCKSITLALIGIQIIFLIIAIIFIVLFLIKPFTRFPILTISVLIIFILSTITISYFTTAYEARGVDADIEDESEADIERHESGPWFYKDIEITGDMEGEGKGRVGSGYVIMIISWIFIFLSLISAGQYHSKSKKLYFARPQPQYTPPPPPPPPSTSQPPPVQHPPPQYSPPPPPPPRNEITEEKPKPKNYCSNCGAKTDGKKFCSECGEKLI